MGTSARRRKQDPTIYPVEDRMGETEWHRAVCVLLWELARRWTEARGKGEHAGSNQFVYWRQHEPTRNVAPDLYVLPECEVGPEGLDVVKTWEHGVPSLAVEIVSTDWRKDYELLPPRYDEIGVSELVIFDAKAPRPRSPERVRWQLWRRLARRGLVRVEAHDGDRVRSKALGAWLREAGAGGELRVRIATGPNGDELFPTLAEATARERARAEEEIERLRAEIERLKRR